MAHDFLKLDEREHAHALVAMATTGNVLAECFWFSIRVVLLIVVVGIASFILWIVFAVLASTTGKCTATWTVFGFACAGSLISGSALAYEVWPCVVRLPEMREVLF